MSTSLIRDEHVLSASLLDPCTVDTKCGAWKAAEADGWDMSQIADALRKPAQERLLAHHHALTQIESVRTDFEKQYGQSGKAH